MGYADIQYSSTGKEAFIGGIRTMDSKLYWDLTVDETEVNLRILEPRAFPLKLAKSVQGFPNLDNNSQGHPTCFKSPWEFTLHLLSSLSISIQVYTQYE
jgi:hypothetical protein